MKEFEVLSVPGTEAIAELEFALEEAADTGYFPILLGDANDYDFLLERIELGKPPEKILGEAVEISVTSWFQEQAAIAASDSGTRQAVPTESRLVNHLDRASGLPMSTVMFGAFKLAAPWQAFAELNWGAWNSSPAPAVHCAIHRYWMERYDARVVSTTSRSIQCRVGRPPQDQEAALQLAREQSLYCRNLVPGKSLVELATRLVNAPYWYFCWE